MRYLIVLILTLLFSGVHAQLIELTLSTGSKVAYTPEQIRIAYGSGTGSIVMFRESRRALSVQENLDYIKSNGCNYFLDVVQRTGERVLINKTYIDYAVQSGTGCRIELKSGYGYVNLQTNYADVTAGLSEGYGCSVPGGVRIGDRVWYVSKQAGCSAAGKLGDPTQPFCSPSQALDSVQAGDLVVIYPGDYTFGDITDSVDIPIDSANLNTTSLFRDGVTWYAYPGVKFISKTEKLNRILFYDSQGRECKLLGHATLTIDTTITMQQCCPPPEGNKVAMFVMLDDTLSRFTLEADKVDLPYPTFGDWAKPVYVLAWKEFYLKIREFIALNGSGGVCFGEFDNPPIASRIAKTFRPKAVVDIKRMFIDSSYYSFAVVWATDNADIVCNFDIVDANRNYQQAPLCFEGRGAVNTKIVYNINELNSFAYSTYTGKGIIYPAIGSLERSPDRSEFILNIKNLKTNMRLFRPGYSSYPNHDSRHVINIDYVSWEGDSLEFVNIPTYKYCKNPIEVNIGRIVNRTVNPAVIKVPNNSQWMMNYSGTIVNGYIEFLGPGNNILFKNCTILPPAGVAPVKSSTAINVPFINCYSNSTVIDPNVTELIEPIVRHANVR